MILRRSLGHPDAAGFRDHQGPRVSRRRNISPDPFAVAIVFPAPAACQFVLWPKFGIPT